MKINKYLVDTFAMVIFSIATGLVIDQIAGMTITQSITARFYAIPINLLTGGLQGVLRDFVFIISHVKENTSKKKIFFLDTFSFILLQVPIYASSLLIAGANTTQVLKGSSVVCIISLFIGRIYGIFLERFRKIFK